VNLIGLDGTSCGAQISLKDIKYLEHVTPLVGIVGGWARLIWPVFSSQVMSGCMTGEECGGGSDEYDSDLSDVLRDAYGDVLIDGAFLNSMLARTRSWLGDYDGPSWEECEALGIGENSQYETGHTDTHVYFAAHDAVGAGGEVAGHTSLIAVSEFAAIAVESVADGVRAVLAIHATQRE